jgi:DNA-binding CsgD family transcriptional regulator
MASSSPEELIDATYRTVLEPAAWSDVMTLMRRSFPSVAQTFYLLHLGPRRLQPVSLEGVEPRWLESFDELFFAPDNPCIRLSPRMHRPGVVRTNERIDRVLRDRGVLYRSSYYNEWMRPQGFKYMIGNTLLAERGIVANITLMRAHDMPTFRGAEVRAFGRVSRHMTRALQLAIRIARPETCPAGIAAFDAMPQAIAVIDAQRHVLYANARMESVLSRKQGLCVRNGEINATHADTRQRFEACVADALALGESAAGGAAPLVLPGGGQRHLSLHVAPLVASGGQSLIARPTVLLMATEHPGPPSVSAGAIGELYGCTASEARLTRLLVEGNRLPQAARAMGITYGTARAYLKIVFDKTGVHTQAQLVARVLGDMATPDARLARNRAQHS